tara:strand:+ start:1917 stop:6689 length:4773 start_codon:yes stop_codon:yes gene_type:complete
MKRIRFLFLFLFAFFISNNLYSKPIPPGAGEGDVAANILFLVDSSDSMKRTVGNALEGVYGVTYDTGGNFIISQGVETKGLVRYTSAGVRDTSDYEDIQYIGDNGCANMVDASDNHSDTDVIKTFDPFVVQGLTAAGTTINGENIIFFRSWTPAGKRAVYGFGENGKNCRIVIGLNDVNAIQGGNADVRKIRVKTIDSTPYLFIMGAKKKGGYLKVVNLSEMESVITTDCNTCRFKNISGFDVTSDGTRIYVTRDGDIFSSELRKVGNSYKDKKNSPGPRCNNVNNPNFNIPQMAHAFDLAIDPDNDEIAYFSSQNNHVIQKINLTNCSILASIGKGSGNKKNEGDPNSLDADLVVFKQPNRITATSTRVVVGTKKGYVDVFDKSKFTAELRDTAWLLNMGTPGVLRWDGLKAAVRAVLADSTMTSGAYFGFGHWNSGEEALGKNTKPKGGKVCHDDPVCEGYYVGWTGSHPDGTSTLCNENSCLNVGISPLGHTKIMGVFDDLGTAWGTDALAFTQIAEDYFKDENAGANVIDSNAVNEEGESCQLNYVIVIGDGEMMNVTSNKVTTRLSNLRKKGVKTLFVAYGGEISDGAIDKFRDLARLGSCTGGQLGDKECEELIESDTPEELKQDLMSKIRQILADKLAFTAPSITATVQEGGSLYQAQFAYEQYGEWRGKLLRKSIDENGVVNHDMSTPTHWNASESIKGQSTEGSTQDTRKLWSALGIVSDDYGGYDNFDSTQNLSIIRDLMESTGYVIQDYHNSTSDCIVGEGQPPLSENAGEDGALDDAIGLINFMKGNDYFDYNGDCNITQVRDHVMGDIYHSQLVEIGPPEANLKFSSVNEEAYFRATNNYQSFKSENASRENIIYVGSNSGVLHAIDAELGNEVWGFIPPFVVTNLPQIMNKSYDGEVDGGGGTNPIFGVDGSPVVHDVFINAVNAKGEVEPSKSWRTILFVPYGRGGSGFSVLDVTKNDEPVHMFSIFNDQINKEVLVADAIGTIEPYAYNSSSASFSNSEEGKKAFQNYSDARTTDEENGNEEMQNARANCVKDNDNYYTSSSVMSCYIGNVFHFSGITTGYKNGETIPLNEIEASKITTGGPEPLTITSAKMVQNKLQITFGEDMVINSFIRDDATGDDLLPTTPFSISTSCKGAGFSDQDMVYNYSELGETWSTPRIARIPSYDSPANPSEDKYVAIFGAGMSLADKCVGSAVFVVSLENFIDNGGREIPAGGIYGAHLNGGPISIVDTKETGIITTSGTQLETVNGSNITNSIPAAPVVITPDTALGIPWRGAMVYINDLEGKITKINLTSQPDAELFDQTTLFRLDASTENARYSYFGMDAGIGVSNAKFYLFGSTGNFTDLGGREDKMDNIMYGLIDPDYPLFKELNGVKIPLGAFDTFQEKAHEGADKARSIDNLENQEEDGTCIDVTGKTKGCIDVSQNENAWVIGLDRGPAGAGFNIREGDPDKNFRKASASPTLYKGSVYFPIYQPPSGNQRCNQGAAFICVADDECGSNGSSSLSLNDPPEDVNRALGNICGYVRKGVLSELVIFGDKLFANVAGPSEDSETLISILSVPGEIISNKGGWRDSSF